ncbi:hypothetical protein K488DRAFT_51274 [Vararia minispora EC-137]|uniref:Uncharacterized protein n=1 Tax=Vararia minispora EC-137 TaxID=1314806 RepID=A0ACB8QJB5_9AGAM|nr:hypothetical protein K488DRAFT_51274 [Vararia minispora EC-137]
MSAILRPDSIRECSVGGQIISGRFHSACGHFIPMSTRFSDCLRSNCRFSSRHAHTAAQCPSDCVRTMAAPIRNPIRISPYRCGNCIQRDYAGSS